VTRIRTQNCSCAGRRGRVCPRARYTGASEVPSHTVSRARARWPSRLLETTTTHWPPRPLFSLAPNSRRVVSAPARRGVCHCALSCSQLRLRQRPATDPPCAARPRALFPRGTPPGPRPVRAGSPFWLCDSTRAASRYGRHVRYDDRRRRCPRRTPWPVAGPGVRRRGHSRLVRPPVVLALSP